MGFLRVELARVPWGHNVGRCLIGLYCIVMYGAGILQHTTAATYLRTYYSQKNVIQVFCVKTGSSFHLSRNFSSLIICTYVTTYYVSDPRPTLYIYSYCTLITFMVYELEGQCNLMILDFTWG